MGDSPEHFGVVSCCSVFSIQELIPEPGIVAFAVPVFPGANWFDVSGFGPDGFDPILRRHARELGSVARREESLVLGYGRARSPQIEQRVAIIGSQVSTVVLHKPH